MMMMTWSEDLHDDSMLAGYDFRYVVLQMTQREKVRERLCVLESIDCTDRMLLLDIYLCS